MEMSTTKSNKSSSEAKWADLPTELLQKLGTYLDCRIDVYRFRAICKSWRSSVPLPPIPPSSHHSSFTDNLFPVTFCRLEDEARNSSFLIKVVETATGELELLKPLTIYKSHIILGKSLNMLDFRLTEVHKCYHFNELNRSYVISDVKKVVVYGRGILVIYKGGRLAFKPFRDTEGPRWLIWHSEHNHVDDIIAYAGQVYVIDSSGVIFWFDSNNLKLVHHLPRLSGIGQQKNLVVSGGELFVVDKHIRQRCLRDDKEKGVVVKEIIGMAVYKFDEERRTWVEVKSLGDRVFVLGNECCFSVSARDFPGCVGNCIYFIDSADLSQDYEAGRRRYYDVRMGYYAARVFSLDDGSVKDVARSANHLQLFSPPKDWFSKGLSFP